MKTQPRKAIPINPTQGDQQTNSRMSTYTPQNMSIVFHPHQSQQANTDQSPDPNHEELISQSEKQFINASQNLQK